MEESVRKEIGRLFIDTGNKIIAGNCVWNDEQMIEACNLIGHIPVSKEEARIGLDVSRATFDNLIAENKLPKGRKESGFKELRWYIDEIILDKLNIRKVLKKLKKL